MKPDQAFLNQYQALNETVGVADLTGRTILTVTGSDRAQFLHSFCTNDVKRLTPGEGCEAFITNPQGKTLGHVFLFCEPEQFVMGTTPGQVTALLTHFDRYVISEDVQFVDRTSEWGVLLVTGPHAARLLRELTGADQPTEILSRVHVTIGGRQVAVRRVDYTSPNDLFFVASRDHIPAIQSACQTAGATACDASAVEARRIENGFPLFGRDITDDNLPQEVGRDTVAISFTKGCYLGQETVARIDAIGHVNRLLVGVKFDADSIPAAGTPLLTGEQQVGHITSAAWSVRLAAPLGLAYVRRMQAKPGTLLNSPAGRAEVVKLPLD